jgi:hypothetical protein
LKQKIAKFLTKRFLMMVGLSILVMMLTTGAVLGTSAWFSSNETGQGTIYVTGGGGGGGSDNYDYTVASIIPFGDAHLSVGGDIDMTASVAISNIGNKDITGFILSDFTFPPNIVSPQLTVDDAAIAAGSSGNAVFHLTGIAPSTPATIDLSWVTCKLLPTGP